MHLIESFLRNPVKVTVGVLLVALFGLIALGSMPMQLTPEVQTPTITIETRWPGASPQEVEQEVVIAQEEQLQSVEGVTKLTSESMDSMGRITMEFLVGTNMDEALLKVNSRLQQVREYPENADQPVISTANASDRPIAWFILSVRQPFAEEYESFIKAHPELTAEVERVRNTQNHGLALLRLRELAKKHPEVEALLPPDIDVTKLRRFAEDTIEARFERVPGVSNSNVIGGLEDELQVIVDPQRLAARQLTVADVRTVLRGQNRDVSGGDFWEGKRRWVVRTLGQFRSAEQVEDQLLAVRDGAPVYIRDVAEVQIGYKKPDGVVRRFGESTIAVNCLRETGANVLDVMDGLRAMTVELNRDVLGPQGLQLSQVYDETEYIYSSINLVQENIFIGGALTMVVLMLFLHLGVRTLLLAPLILLTAVAAAFVSPWYFAVSLLLILIGGFWFARGALVVGLAIPTSIIGTFLMLSLMGRSLNVISLAGLAFAVGMLVDNAVVVLENIYSHYHRGESPFTATVRGTQEVWGAVVASTLTTIAVFLPVVFVEQEAGQLFRDIALAISSAVALSLIVSVVLIPTAASRLFPRREGDDEETAATHGNGRPHAAPHDGAERRPVPESASHSERLSFTDKLSRTVVAPINAGADFFVRFVVGVNGWVQRGLLRRIVTLLLLVGTSVSLGWLLWPKVEYLPTGNRNLVFGILLPPPGYNLDQLMVLGQKVEDDLRPYWDIDPGSPEAEALDAPAIGDFFFVARGRSVFIGVRAQDPMRAGELVPLVRRVGFSLPGTIAVANQSSLFEQNLGGGRSVDIEITGPDLEKLVSLGGQVFGKVMQTIPDAQARPIPSLDLSSPELHVVPLLRQAAETGIFTTDLGYTVDALVDGAYASDYFIGGDKIDLVIRGRDEFAEQTQDIQSLPIATPTGQLVPLGAVADVSLSSGPEQVNHRERQRAITISVTPPPEMALEDAMVRITEEIVGPLRESGQLDGGYMITLAGTADKLRSTWDALRFNVLLALLITYLLMAALFESWMYPLVIIFSVPLGAVGGILGLEALNWYLVGFQKQPPQTLDVLTMLGFVILIGTVVNNAILIVHQSLVHMREEGMEPRPAILASVRSRMRPIFMTTTTTVLGLLPLVLFPGAGSELYRGLGSVVLGGLVVSTVFTLFLVPVAFSLAMDIKWLVGSTFDRVFRRRVRLRPSIAAGPAILDEPQRPHEESEKKELVAHEER